MDPAHEINHRGRRFAIGQTPEYYGVWELEGSTEAVRRFSKTPEGWAEAWGAFLAMDGRGRDLEGRPPNVTAAAVIQIVLGALLILFGLAVIAATDEVVELSSGAVVALGSITILQGALDLLAGIQILRRVRWGRVLGIVMSSLGVVFALLALPGQASASIVLALVGVSARGYVLWALATWGGTRSRRGPEARPIAGGPSKSCVHCGQELPKRAFLCTSCGQPAGRG